MKSCASPELHQLIDQWTDNYSSFAQEDVHITIDNVHSISNSIPYTISYTLLFVFYLLCVLTLGALPLIVKWFPRLKIWMTHIQSHSNATATCVLIQSASNGEWAICPVQSTEVHLKESQYFLKTLFYRRVCFIYDDRQDAFVKLQFHFGGKTNAELHAMRNGLSDDERQLRKELFGPNKLETPVRSWLLLLFDEVLNPLYIFQLFAVTSWLLVRYWLYSVVVILMSVSSAVTNLWQTRQNLKKVHAMGRQPATVRRLIEDGFQTVDSSQIVPGDVIEIDTELTCCDIVLLSERDSSHILFCGTQVLMLIGTKKPIGLCIRTGFDTTRGKLILSILHPRTSSFQFYKDSLGFVGFLSAIGFLGILYSGVRFIDMKVPWIEIILRCANYLTVAVPPALPLSITVCTSIAMDRLKKARVYTTSPTCVITSGQVDCVCFDKTGTLTSGGMRLMGVLPCHRAQFREIVKSEELYESLTDKECETEFYNFKATLLKCLSSAHSLALSPEKTVVGDPLEVEIFKAVRSTLNTSPSDGMWHIGLNNQSPSASELSDELEIVKHFEFSSQLRTMSVIARDVKSGNCFVFVKGAPEKISEISDRNSIPSNFPLIVHRYAKKGLRIVAVAKKELPATFNLSSLETINRTIIEQNVVFLGFVIMDNKLKKSAKRTVALLSKARIFNVMATGDNISTAVAVAQKCGIMPRTERVVIGDINENREFEWTDSDQIKTNDIIVSDFSTNVTGFNTSEQQQIAVTGSAFEYLFKQHQYSAGVVSEYEKILCTCTVYARMNAEHKTLLCSELMRIGYYVAMIGDGANDAPALRSATVGISLSQTEASIAAPFTSMKSTIDCVPTIIREGRAALATAFQMFLYMGCYSFIQFFGVVLLYDINSTYGDYQFLIGDLLTDFPVCLLMCNALANRKLAKDKPMTTLFNSRTITSYLFQIILACGVQLMLLFYMRQQSWYELLINFYTPDGQYIDASLNVVCFETTTLFIVASFQYWASAMSYSISSPFKRPLYTNKLYFGYMCLLFLMLVYVCIIPDSHTKYWLQLASLPLNFRVVLLAVSLVNVIACICFERFVVLGLLRKLSRLITFSKVKYYLKKMLLCRKMTTQDEVKSYSHLRYHQVRWLLQNQPL